MILTKTINIKIHKKNIEHFRNKGYKCELKDIIEINTIDLNYGSREIIKVKCDNPNCGNEKELEFKVYIKNTKKLTTYYSCCRKCANEKIKNTNLKKYGCEFATQNILIKEKTKKTNLKKYNVEYPQMLDEIKEKIKNTNLEKYGFEVSSKNELVKEKYRNTCIERYGVHSTALLDDVKEKAKKTNLEKYGVEYYTQTEEFKIKNSEYWGYSNPLEKEDYYFFRRKVDTLSNKLYDDLKEEWDGCDYYTGEYIKDNYNLYDKYHPKYPNVDHKISVKYGYENGYSIEELSDISNLCITTRLNNIKKKNKNEEEFKKALEKI